MKKRIMSMLLTIVMLLSLMPMSVFAAGVSNGVITLTPDDLVEGASGEGWSFSGNTLTINSGYTLNFEGTCGADVSNDGTITGGTFAGKITNNDGTIEDITIELSNALIEGGASYGWSLDQDNKLILNSGITYYWKAGEECGYVVDNDGTISGGTFNSKVKNDGTISGGTFGNEVTNQGTITNGIFSGEVLNNGTISGGTFSGNVNNNTVYAVISNGTFSGDVVNYGTITGGGFNGNVDNGNTISGGSFRCDIGEIADIPGVTLIHTPGTEWTSDGNNHWHECSCGAKTDSAAHTGGTATCTAKADCETCAQPYGNFAQHSAAAAWSKNETHHWHLCVYWTEGGSCQEAFDYAEHADADGSGACDACGYAMAVTPPPHTHSLGYKYNESGHWQECTDASCPDVESSRTAAEDHSYGSDRACDACGYTKPAPYIPPSAPTWRPDVDRGENGDVTVTPRYPEQGDTVIITPEPDKGYEVDEIIVTDRNGESVTVTDKGDGTYRFKQPYGKVTITVTFRKEVCSGGADCPISSFTDLDSDAWYHEAIDFVMDNDMMSGYPGNLFGPNDSITRGQIVTILHRLEGTPVVNYLMTYEDVDQEKYYAEAIRWATSEGIVAGYGNDSFGPDDPITRQQLAAILWRYSQHKGYDVSVGENTNILSFEDAFDISEYAIPAMQWACGAGVMGGYGNGYLGPNDGATRAQAAQMLKNFMVKAAK